MSLSSTPTVLSPLPLQESLSFPGGPRQLPGILLGLWLQWRPRHASGDGQVTSGAGQRVFPTWGCEFLALWRHAGDEFTSGCRDLAEGPFLSGSSSTETGLGHAHVGLQEP